MVRVLAGDDAPRAHGSGRPSAARDAQATRGAGGRPRLVTTIPWLELTCRDRPTEPASYLYEPSLSLMVQGSKRVVLGTTTYRYDASLFLLTAVDLPTISQVLEASPEYPYISVLLKLDLTAAKRMMADLAVDGRAEEASGTAMATGPATAALLDALGRLLALLDTPADIPVLGELLQREMLYRVLTSPAGARLRQMVRLGTQTNRVARAITWLRENPTRPLRIEQLARLSGMGVSTLHHHFRALTAMSPLQYQKHLRLHEARRLLLAEDLDAGTAALRVGYESVTQFNREYRRFFGAPPMRDVKALRGR